MIVNKPYHMSAKEWLIKSVGMRHNVPQAIINKVVQHQSDGANAALKKHNSIEISGFGKFFFNQKKAEKEMEKFFSQKKMYRKVLDDDGITEQKRFAYEKRVITIERNIEALTNKFNQGKEGDEEV